jgi:hypothetical protein
MQSQPMRESLRTHTLYFFQIVKDPNSLGLKNRYQSKYLSLALISLLVVSGGGERDRTDDLLLAKQALSQLSYTPDSAFVHPLVVPPALRGGSGWVRTNDPRLIKTVL